MFNAVNSGVITSYFEPGELKRIYCFLFPDWIKISMHNDQILVFRKAIVPWYDSDIACIVTAIAMVAFFLFAIDGILIASEIRQYYGYIWIPALVAILSAIVFLSIMSRWIIRQYSER